MTIAPASPPRLRVGPVSALLFGIGLLVLGNGLQGTLLGVRAGLEGFRQETIGLMMSAYFAGYVAGSIWCPRLIDQAGHIRVFAALASIASAATLTHALTIEPTSWTFLRALNGACYAGLGIVTESWLNGHAAPGRRGQLLAIYGVVTMGAWAASQLLLNLADPAGFILFCLVSVLLSLALVPIALTRAAVPVTADQARVSLKKLYAISPLGFAGCLLTGLAMSAFWGMGPTFAQQIGLNNIHLSLFMAAPIVGAVVLQWPLGWVSDQIDRRGVIAGSCLLNSLLCLALAGWSGPLVGLLGLAGLFGGLGIPLYSLCVAHVNDYIEPEALVSVAGGLLLLYGLGAALGPFLAGALMGQVGPSGLFLYIAPLQLALFGFALYRMSRRPTRPKTQQDAFVAMPGSAYISTQAAFEFDPRGQQKTPAGISTSKGDNRMAKKNKPPLVYSCSGCSSAAQMANDLAVRLDREKVAEMSCIAGVGGDVPALVKTATSGRKIIAIDGCPLHCAKHCLARHNVSPAVHLDLMEYGVKKRYHRDYDPDEAEQVWRKILEEVK